MIPGFCQYTPTGPLSEYAEAVWLYTPADAGGLGAAARPIRVLPDGCTDLIARVRLTRTGVEPLDLTVCGSTARHRVIERRADEGYVGVRFRRWAAGAALGLHAPDLLEARVKASDCSRPLGRLFDRMDEGPNLPALASALVAGLTAFANAAAADESNRRARRAVELLEASGGGAQVRGIARASGVTERTVNRDSLRAAGMAPKALGRIIRFRRAVGLLGEATGDDLCGVALACGYADQAHLTREFQAFGGLTPGAAGRLAGLDWV